MLTSPSIVARRVARRTARRGWANGLWWEKAENACEGHFKSCSCVYGSQQSSTRLPSLMDLFAKKTSLWFMSTGSRVHPVLLFSNHSLIPLKPPTRTSSIWKRRASYQPLQKAAVEHQLESGIFVESCVERSDSHHVSYRWRIAPTCDRRGQGWRHSKHSGEAYGQVELLGDWWLSELVRCRYYVHGGHLCGGFVHCPLINVDLNQRIADSRQNIILQYQAEVLLTPC